MLDHVPHAVAGVPPKERLNGSVDPSKDTTPLPINITASMVFKEALDQ
jgi:hypothetical protein